MSLGRTIMTARFRTRIAQPPSPELVHMLRNLGEDLHRALGEKGRVDMAEVDSATESFFVQVSEKRYLGDVTTLLKKHVGHGTAGAYFAFERA
jgi:hypothetical protein